MKMPGMKLIALHRILFISHKKRKILFSECTGLSGTAGRIPGRTAEEVEKFWTIKHQDT
uniref:Uncharacterized protein n=1 Tax=Oryza nivara TaxID=4536 RepID=A0A0E0FPN3_ORYNI